MWLFLAPSLLGVSLFVLLPFLDAVRRSFYDSVGKEFLGFDVYRKVLGNEAFLLAAGNTARFMATALPLLLFLSFFLSLLTYQYSRERSFFKTVLVLPVAVPAASVVLLWRMVFCEGGLINGIFGLNTDWIHGPDSFTALVASYLWKNMGYQMLLWLAALSGIPDELYEAAQIDGAGWFQKQRYVTIPQLKQPFGTILFLAVVNSFKAFREAYIVAGTYPNKRIYLMQHLFNHWFLNLDVQKMSAAAVLMAAVITGSVLLAAGKRHKE